MTWEVTHGQVLAARYVIGPMVGRGGMASVHRCWDRVLEREVAVKILDGLLPDPDARLRFGREVAMLAALDHPALLTVLDAGSECDRPYLVTELVDGETLAGRLRRDRPGPATVAFIGCRLAEALAYVHDAGVVHRDVKPANVLLAADDVRLADFGIARAIGACRDTAPGLTLGTAAYLAPEQVRGDPATAASDIYSLGLALVEAVTGRAVYTGTPDVAALARLISSPRIDPTVPSPLRRLLEQATADRPQDRPTAGQVAQELNGMLEVLPTSPLLIGSCPIGPDEQTRPIQVAA